MSSVLPWPENLNVHEQILYPQLLGWSPTNLGTVGSGWKDTAPPNLELKRVFRGKLLFILLFIHGGERGCGASRLAWPLCEASLGAGSRLPGREGCRRHDLGACPGQGGLLAERKEQLHPGKRIAFLRPIDFLIFWHFLVASIPFLVFSSMSQKTKMSQQLRAEISISCQTAVFPALTKRAPHRMPRTGKMTNYIIFPP